MKVLKKGSTGQEVIYLQQLLQNKGYDIFDNGVFGDGTYEKIIQFQKDCKLVADGIVSEKTWNALIDSNSPYYTLTHKDYLECASILGVDVATIKAIQEVETGSVGGFLYPNKPTILFEGHIFWNELKKKGKNPENYVKGNEDILYPKWTKQFYKGKNGEWDRLEKAMQIDKISAISAASWGAFQIMGFNYKVCNCYSVEEFVEEMSKNLKSQLKLFIYFIKNNKLDSYLKMKDWAGFAKKYNGPAYAENKYDVKLHQAYEKWSR